MRLISINNNLLRHEQILNCYIFAIMTLLICNAMTLTSDKYKILYIEIARVVTSQQNSSLQSIAPNSRLCTIMHLAMRSKQRKMRCNYNPKTRLQNNNRYAEAVVYTTEYKDISSLNYTQFIQTLKREVEFKNKRSSIYYYTKTADNTVATKLYRATFIIKLLI
ncbi:hypothetical protein HBI25_209760 [Parastagonospora nodorum]|nr:hypothetical protein HBI25_209760 [Parastagonospora nodorum]